MNKKQNSKQKIQKLAENDARPERAIQPTELLNDTLRRIFGCELADATQKQVYRALCISVRELLTEKNRVFGNRCTEKERKEVYYMSMEFLVGTSLRNNLFNLGLEAEFRKALADAASTSMRSTPSIPTPALETAALAVWPPAIWMPRPAWTTR